MLLAHTLYYALLITTFANNMVYSKNIAPRERFTILLLGLKCITFYILRIHYVFKDKTMDASLSKKYVPKYSANKDWHL